MTADRPFIGILFMLAFCVLAPMGDAFAKVLGETIPLVQLLLVRFAAQAVLFLPFGPVLRLSRRAYWLTALRTLLHIAGVGAMFTSLRYLPLADAVAIAFVMPFILLVLGKYFLNEEVGRVRIAACCVGFGGTLLVIQPSFAEVGLPALWPLFVAFAFAGFMLVTRQVAKEADAISIQTVSGMMATVILGLALLATRGSDIAILQIVMPDRHEAMLLAGIGLIGTVAHLMMTWSLRFAPSTTLAPMQYLEIPVATLIGWIVFRDLPNGLAAVGIVVTIGAGLFIVLREQATARRLAAGQGTI